MRELNLEQLKKGMLGFSPGIGTFLYEALVFCLVECGHKSGVRLNVFGEINENLLLVWNEEIGMQSENYWQNQRMATEHGAVAISILILKELLSYEVVRTMEIGTGVDYLMKDNSTNKESLLEVSGVWEENIGNTINVRVNRKIKQTEKSRDENKDIFISVVEFKSPEAKITKI